MSHEQVQNPPKKRGCQRGCLTIVVVLITLVVVFIWFNIPTPLRISPETTYITTPLMPDGKRVDYFRAMEEKFYPPEMKTDDNGYRLLVRAFGENAWQRETTNPTIGEIRDALKPDHSQYIYEKLGLAPNDVSTTPLKIESPTALLYRVSVDQSSFDQAAAFQQVSFWTLDDYPMLEQWLEENTACIDVLAEAVRKPMFYGVHFVRENENSSMFMPQVSGVLFRDWAEAVRARATYRLGIGDIDGAIDDLVTLHRLGRHTGRQVTLLSWVVGLYMEATGSSIGIGSNPNFTPTKEQIARLLTELTALPPRQTFSEVVETERFFSLAALQDVYYNQIDLFGRETFLTKNIRWLVDINVFLSRCNKHFDEQISETIDISTWQPSRNPLSYLFIRSRTIQIHDTIGVVALRGQRERAQSQECLANMQLLTLALLLYEKEHDKLPDGDWRAAIQPYLAGTPADEANADKYFRCPSCPAAEDETTYVMISGTSNQVLLVETHEPQTNEPRTLESVMNALGSNHSGSVNVGLRSGAIRSLDKDTAPDELRKLLNGTDGELP